MANPENDVTAVEVLIVGAGPTGLTLACDLARNGVDVRVIERAAAFNTASKAKTIQPRALEVLDDLGAVAPVVEVGVTDLPMRFYGPDGGFTDKPGISTRADESFNSPYPDPVWIGQFDIEKALRARFAELGGEVELATEATALVQDDTGVTVTTGSGEIRAQYVVGSDGGRSTVRKLVGLPLVGETYESQRWYLGDVLTTDLERDHIHIWPSKDGMVGLTPLPGSDLWQLQSPISPEVEEPQEPSLEFYQAMFDERAGAGTVTLTGASWLSAPNINVRMVETYRKGRVLLAGDAAHVHSPAGGHGMNTGIQDAHNLGWKLSAVVRGAFDSLLDTYTDERAPIARMVLEDSSGKMKRTLTTSRGSGEGLSRSLHSLSDDITSGLPIAYLDSPLTLSDEEHGHETLPAGSRAPDAGGLSGRDSSGEPFEGSLFDLFRGTHWTLLVFDHEGDLLLDQAKPDHMHLYRIGDNDRANLQDTQGQVREAYDPRPGELVLVRPDGYIAARIPAEQEMRMIELLSGFRPEGANAR